MPGAYWNIGLTSREISGSGRAALGVVANIKHTAAKPRSDVRLLIDLPIRFVRYVPLRYCAALCNSSGLSCRSPIALLQGPQISPLNFPVKWQ